MKKPLNLHVKVVVPIATVRVTFAVRPTQGEIIHKDECTVPGKVVRQGDDFHIVPGGIRVRGMVEKDQFVTGTSGISDSISFNLNRITSIYAYEDEWETVEMVVPCVARWFLHTNSGVVRLEGDYAKNDVADEQPEKGKPIPLNTFVAVCGSSVPLSWFDTLVLSVQSQLMSMR